MYLNSELNLNSGKMYLDSSKVYLNLRKRMIKFWNVYDDSKIQILQISLTQFFGCFIQNLLVDGIFNRLNPKVLFELRNILMIQWKFV